MTTKTYFYTTTLTVTSCGNCGIPFAIPDNLYRARNDDGGGFYCPNGHNISWAAANAKAKLERELKAEQDRAIRLRGELDQTIASRSAWKGHVARLRKQVLAGECPICGQHLRDLARHIGRMHHDATAEIEKPE